jgi:hypothetical protein
LLAALFFVAFYAYGQQKYALVIGNAAYTAVTPPNGENYLIPVNADIQTESRLRYDALHLQYEEI